MSIALIIIVLVDPIATSNNGFWMSFGAVFALIYALSGYNSSDGCRAKVLALLKTQWVVFLALIPLLALFSSQIPIVSFAVNLIAIPWFGIFVVSGLLLGMVLLWSWPIVGVPVLKFTGFLVDLLW